MREVTLYYPDLHVEFDYGPEERIDGRGIGVGSKYFDREVEYEYNVDRNAVEEVIFDLIPEDEQEEIVAKNSAPYEKDDAVDIIYEYIDYNFDDLFDKYQDEILDAFRENAEYEATTRIEPEDYLESLVNSKGKKKMNESQKVNGIESFVDFLNGRVLTPRARGEKYPPFDPTFINESKFADTMRFKSYDFEVEDPTTIHLEWITQEPFDSEEGESFIDELNRALPKMAKKAGFTDPFSLVVEVSVRGEADVSLSRTISVNDKNNNLNEEFTEDGWSKDLQDRFKFLKNHKHHGEHYSKDVKIWDLGLTDKQEEYFSDFLQSGALESFWIENKELAKDIYQEGRSMGHLILGVDYGEEEPLEYDPFNFQVDDLDEAFELWCINTYDLYPDEYAYNEEEMADLTDEFIDWFNNVYLIVTDFNERAEKLVELFKQALDDYIEQEEAPSDDLTETMFSEVEDIKEPELDKPEYDEINESYFDSSTKYLVVDVSGYYLNEFEDADEAIDWAESNWKALEVQEITDDSAITIWRRNGFPDGDKDDFDECYDNASDELPKLEESVDFNPDFDDDFAGHHYTSYDLYKAQQEEEEKEYSDEEAFEERDPNRYDDEHAKEWMKRHPHGWYNSESDYGVGDEEDEGPEEPLYEDLKGQILEFNDGTYFYVQKKGNSLIAGNATNTGIIPEFEIEYDEDKSENENLQDLYDIIIEEHPEFLEENYQCNHNSLNTLEEKYFDYNKYKLPHDVIKFIKETAEKDIEERARFADDDWSKMDSQDTSDWVMDRIEIKFPGWKWTDENMSYVETVVDDVFDMMRKEKLDEGVMSDLDIDAQEAGGYDKLTAKLEYEISKLRQERNFLKNQAPKEIGRGGAFDSQEEINDALSATERALNRAEMKLSIVRGNR